MICEIITGYITNDKETTALRDKVNSFRKSLEGSNQPDEITTTWVQSHYNDYPWLTAIVEYARDPKDYVRAI